jgi:hypothetical protein
VPKTRRSLTTWLFLLSLLALAVMLRATLVRALVNAGNVQFLRMCVGQRGLRESSPELGRSGGVSKTDADVAIGLFEDALLLSDDDFGARKGLGRALLFDERAEEAARVLQPLADSRVLAPHFFLDILKAYSRANWENELLGLANSGGWMSVPEAVLCRFDWGAQTRNVSRSYVAWRGREQVAGSPVGPEEVTTRGAPLPQQIACVEWMTAKGDSLGLLNCQSGLMGFDLSGLLDRSGSLSKANLDAVPRLVRSGLWSMQMARRTVSWLVWRYYTAGMVGETLTTLIDENPQSPVWPLLYGEFLQRRGKMVQAYRSYRHSYEIDNSRPETLLRLGMTSEAMAMGADNRQELLRRARTWYQRCLDIHGGDLLAGKRLLRVSEQLGENSCEELAEDVQQKTNLRASVARLLDVDTTQFQLGPNLSTVGEFEEWILEPYRHSDRPRGWDISDMAYPGSSFNLGAFISGPDSLDGWTGSSARITGLWLERREDKKRGRFGFWADVGQQSEISLDPGASYAIAFYYRTVDQVEGPTVWLSSNNQVLLHGSSGSDDYRLPETHGEWWRFVAVAKNRSHTAERARPLLRTYETGQVWIDQFTISKIRPDRPISLSEPVRVRFEKLSSWPGQVPAQDPDCRRP